MSSRENQQFGPYGEYTADETAAKYGASPSETTQDDSNMVPWEISHPAAYQNGWLTRLVSRRFPEGPAFSPANPACRVPRSERETGDLRKYVCRQPERSSLCFCSA